MKIILRAVLAVLAINIVGCGGRVDHTDRTTPDQGGSAGSAGSASYTPCSLKHCPLGTVCAIDLETLETSCIPDTFGTGGSGGQAGSAGSGGSSGQGGQAGTGDAGGSAGSGGSPLVCTPGTGIYCVIPGSSVSGQQFCNADGVGYGECVYCNPCCTSNDQCPNGSTCIDHGCVISGGTGGSGGSGGAGGCTPTLFVTNHTHPQMDIPRGTTNVEFESADLEASPCGDVTVDNVGAALESSDPASDPTSLFCAGQCTSSSWYFTDARLMNGNTTVAGPLGLDYVGAATPPNGNAWFTDTFTLKAGQKMHLTFRLDVADSPAIVGHHYRSLLHTLIVHKPAAVQGYDVETQNVITIVEPAQDPFFFCKQKPTDITDGCCTTGSFPHDAATPLSGMNIKGEGGNMVYYVGSNGKRYVYTTKDVILSWFDVTPTSLVADETGSSFCKTVREFPDAVLASVPIGGNVTIRPGTYLARIATDPKVYAISRHATLRWIGNQLQSQPGSTVYGTTTPGSDDVVHVIFPDAEQRVRIISDAFFVNYLVGSSIDTAAMYDPAVEYDWGAPAMMERELGILP